MVKLTLKLKSKDAKIKSIQIALIRRQKICYFSHTLAQIAQIVQKIQSAIDF